MRFAWILVFLFGVSFIAYKTLGWDVPVLGVMTTLVEPVPLVNGVTLHQGSLGKKYKKAPLHNHIKTFL